MFITPFTEAEMVYNKIENETRDKVLEEVHVINTQ